MTVLQLRPATAEGGQSAVKPIPAEPTALRPLPSEPIEVTAVRQVPTALISAAVNLDRQLGT